MATTTNFGWETPDDTDLVKDGAAAIRTALGGVDTSFVDLKGGTTGQVLSKASNTDLDYTWVTTDDANAIQNAIVDAKGDLIAASAADTPARLAVGNNGETLVADSSTSTGLRYNPTQAAGKNAIINGGMDIWQRGTSITTSAGYTADRWYLLSGASATVTRSTAKTTPNSTYMMLMTASTTQQLFALQSIESLNAIYYAGKTVTVSGYAAGLTTTTNLNMALQYSTNTDEAILGTWTGITASGGSPDLTLSSTVTRFSATFAVPSTAKSLRVQFVNNAANITVGQGIYLGDVQLEVGSVATAFSRAGGTIQGELAACQRYYYQIATGNSVPISLVWYDSATLIRGLYQMPVTMRTTSPTLVQTTGTNYYTTQDGDGFNSLTLYNSAASVVAWYNNTEVSGTNSRPQAISTNNASASLGLSAEL